MTIQLPNHNNDTLAARIEEILERLEPLEGLLAMIPGFAPYAAAAESATIAADTIVKDVDQGVAGFKAALPAPAIVPAAPAPVAKPVVAAPTIVAPAPAAPSPAAILAAAWKAQQAGISAA